MDHATAETALNWITAGMAAVWLGGAIVARRCLAGAEEPANGSAEHQGPPAALARAAAAVLATTGLVDAQRRVLGGVRITSATDDRVTWTCDLPGRRHDGELRFSRATAGRTTVTWRLDYRPPRFARWFVPIGALGIVALHAVLRAFAAPAAAEPMRWQVLQMFQAIHLLWPAYVFGAMPLGIRKVIAGTIATLVANLPYTVKLSLPVAEAASE